jgi:hyaluronoglucosaminidase
VSFGIRGLIEGFYNRLWTMDERRRVGEFTASHGFDTYVYAPKEDRLQNAGWRTPYPATQRSELAEFGERCREVGMRYWMGLRPVGMSYVDEADATLVVEKLRDYLDLGADRLVLLADDIPSELDARSGGRFTELVDAHLWLVEHVLGALDLAPERLVFVPTDYAGFGSPYLVAIGSRLPAGIEVCWTGADVCSRAIPSSDATAIAQVVGRLPLIWDNYPVNDAGMTDQLHIGPIRDRAGDLDAHVSGILVNPALQPAATLVPLATWGEYLRDPAGYDPDAAWHRALLEVTGNPDDAEAVAIVAAAFDRSVIRQPWGAPPPERLDAAAHVVRGMQNRQLAGDLLGLIPGS